MQRVALFAAGYPEIGSRVGETTASVCTIHVLHPAYQTHNRWYEGNPVTGVLSGRYPGWVGWGWVGRVGGGGVFEGSSRNLSDLFLPT